MPFDPKFKVHLARTSRTTWCGRPIARVENLTNLQIGVSPEALCKICRKADLAEARRNG